MRPSSTCSSNNDGWSSGSSYGSCFWVRAAGVVFSAVDDLCAEVQQVGAFTGAAVVQQVGGFTGAAADVEGSAHGASGERLVSEANGAVAAAPEPHGAKLGLTLGSYIAGRTKFPRGKRRREDIRRRGKNGERSSLWRLAVRRWQRNSRT
jgi:hypothetical protein